MNLLDTLKKEKMKSKKTIVHCCLIFLYLNLHPFVPLEHIVLLFPSFPLFCEIFIEIGRIEVMEDSVSLVHRSADTVCHYCIYVLLIEIYFPVQYMCILNMNIESMDVFTFLYRIDYIC